MAIVSLGAVLLLMAKSTPSQIHQAYCCQQSLSETAVNYVTDLLKTLMTSALPTG